MWVIKFTKAAEKDKKLLKSANLEKKAKEILNLMMKDPFIYPPKYEKLIGSLTGFYSRRINIKHRIVYRVDKENHLIIVYMMFTHYGR